MKRLIPANMEVLSVLLISMLGLAFAIPAHADEVYLKTGEILHCKVIAKDDKQITIKHTILGEIKIASNQVKKIITDAQIAATKQAKVNKAKAAAIAKEKTAAAAKLKAVAAAEAKKKAAAAAKTKAVAAAKAKEKAAAAAKIKAAATAKSKAAAAIVAKKKTAAAAKLKSIAAKEKAERISLVKKIKGEAWKFHLDLGLNGKTGNSDSFDFRTKLRAETKSPTGRLRYEFSFYTRKNRW